MNTPPHTDKPQFTEAAEPDAWYREAGVARVATASGHRAEPGLADERR